MRLLKALIVSILLSGVTFVVTAVALGIFNIYLSGHGIDWPNQNFDNGMSPLSYLLGVIVMTVFLITFILMMRITKADTSPKPEEPDQE